MTPQVCHFARRQTLNLDTSVAHGGPAVERKEGCPFQTASAFLILLYLFFDDLFGDELPVNFNFHNV